MSWTVEPRDPKTQSPGEVTGYAQTFRRWPSQPLLVRPHDIGELSGPERIERRLPASKADLAGPGANRASGRLIPLRARVVDEGGTPVPGARVEIWNCNAAGKYPHPNDTNAAPADPNFHGNARLIAGDSGLVELRTVKPG